MNYWFKGKRYGYGWYPATWQGWLVLAVYLIILGAFVAYNVSFGENFNVLLYLAGVFFITAALIYICYKKGEPTRWRWGK
jgi:hypothetical protein